MWCRKYIKPVTRESKFEPAVTEEIGVLAMWDRDCLSSLFAKYEVM